MFSRNIKDKLIDMLIVLLIVTLLLLGYRYMIRQAPKDFIADDEYKRIMRKHGITSLYEDYEGRMFFYRDGRKVYIQIPGAPGAGEGVQVSPGTAVEN
jgi:hypothetical protein